MLMFPRLTELCGASEPTTAVAIALALFFTGLAGGLAHCGPMCGPFVLMQLTERNQDQCLKRRTASGLLPAYHLGRATTYVVLGAVAGSLGGAVAQLAPFRLGLAVLLAAAALAFLFQALKPLLPKPEYLGMESPIAALLVPVAGFLARRCAGRSGYLLGLVLGLLPCGFLYAALSAAGATANVFVGAGVMAAFALGTAPALASIGLIGTVAMRRWRSLGTITAPPVFLLNAMILGACAWRVIP